MTPEEILRKVGLNGKVLKEFALGKLLTDGGATHSTVILGDVENYLKKLNIPIDLIGDIQEPLFLELRSMVPESTTFRNILLGKNKVGSEIIELQNSFNNLVKAHLRMPLSMDTFRKLEEGADLFESKFFEVADYLNPRYREGFGSRGLGDITADFDDFQNKIFDSTFDSNTKLEDYVNTRVKNVTQYVDDFVMPEGIDTPTNVVDDVLVGIDRSGKEATVLVDENGYVELFRATDNPERLVISDFTKQGDIQSAGLGTQNYFATNAPYANKYTGTNKKLYKFSTNIKPNEILDISPVSLKNKHPELYTLIFGENEIRNTKAIQDNIETIKELGYKAIGNRETGSTGLLEVAQYEIIPLTTANETYNIKPIATLQTKEGFAAGKSPEAFIETSLDTPTNVVPSTSSINEPDFIIKDSPIGPNTTKELKGLIDPELAAKAARVLQSSKEVGEAIVSSAQALAKNALKVGGKTLGVLDPGDVVISKSIPKLFASLGVTTLSSGALTVYAIYEGALLLADAVSGLQEANKKAGIGANRSEDFTGYSFTGGQTIDGRDVASQQADFSSYGKDFWQGFTEDSVSDKYSLSYKLSKEIHNSLFGIVYGTIAETPKTPVGASGGGRVRIL